MYPSDKLTNRQSTEHRAHTIRSDYRTIVLNRNWSEVFYLTMISYVGKRVATDAVSDLTEPLISLPTNSINPNAIDDSGETKAEYPLLLTVAHGLLVLGGLATSMVAIVSSSAISVYVACSVCIVNSIAVAVKQRTIFKSGGLREGIKALQGGVGLLLAEVNNLVSVVDDLQGEADCLSDIQKQLDDIVRDQGSNSNEFISLLKENESNLKKMKVKGYLRYEIFNVNLHRSVITNTNEIASNLFDL